MFKSACGCVPLSLELRAFFSLASEYLVLTPALFCCDDVPVSSRLSDFLGSGSFSSGFCLTFTSLSEQHCRLCIISGGNRDSSDFPI